MITLHELGNLILAIIIFAFIASFPNLEQFAIALLFSTTIILIYILSKKLMAYHLETEIEAKIWQFKRYGLYERSYFKTPIPAGIILPFLLSLLTLGYIKFLGLLQTDEKALSTRAVKRHDFYSFSELTEWHISLISATGIISCLVLALLAYLVNLPELAKLSIYFSISNLIPLGKLDGTKIFFGSKVLYAILLVLSLIFLGYALFLP